MILIGELGSARARELLIGCALGAAMAALYFSSWERPAHEVVQERAGSLWQALKKLAKDMISTFHLKIFRKHLGWALSRLHERQLIDAEGLAAARAALLVANDNHKVAAGLKQIYGEASQGRGLAA